MSIRQHHDTVWKLSLKFGRNIFACLLVWSKASLSHWLLVLKLENSTYDVSTKLIWNPVAPDTVRVSEEFVFSSGTFWPTYTFFHHFFSLLVFASQTLYCPLRHRQTDRGKEPVSFFSFLFFFAALANSSFLSETSTVMLEDHWNHSTTVHQLGTSGSANVVLRLVALFSKLTQ